MKHFADMALAGQIVLFFLIGSALLVFALVRAAAKAEQRMEDLEDEI